MKRTMFVVLALVLVAAGMQAQGKVKVIYWEKWTGVEQIAPQMIVDAFNKSQNRIEVEYQWVEPENKLRAAMAAGETPADVVGSRIGDMRDLAQQGLFQPIDAWAKALGVDANYFYPGFWEGSLYKGKLYGMPSTGHLWLMYYNKKLFREAGLDPEKPTTTMEDLIAANVKLTKFDSAGNITQLGYSYMAPGMNWSQYRWPWYFGAELWDPATNKIVNDPKVHAAYRWLYDENKRLGAAKLQKYLATFGDWGTPKEPFMSGKVAITFQGPWFPLQFRTYAPNIEAGVALWPSVKGAKRVAFVDSDTLSVPTGAKHPAEAVEFMKFFNSKEGQMLLNGGKDGAGRIPTLVNYGGDEFVKASQNPFTKLYMQLMGDKTVTQKTPPAMPAFGTFQTEMGATMEKIYLTGADPDKELDAAIARAQAAVDKALKQ